MFDCAQAKTGLSSQVYQQFLEAQADQAAGAAALVRLLAERIQLQGLAGPDSFTLKTENAANVHHSVDALHASMQGLTRAWLVRPADVQAPAGPRLCSMTLTQQRVQATQNPGRSAAEEAELEADEVWIRKALDRLKKCHQLPPLEPLAEAPKVWT